MQVPEGAPTVLVVDDEPTIADSLQKILERESLRVLTAGSGGEALDIIRREPVSVLLTDLDDGRHVRHRPAARQQSLAPETETVLMTAYGTVENAVEAMKQGAYDFVTKPLKRAHLLRVVGKALEKRSLVQENRSLRAQLAARRSAALIGQSLPWRRTMDIVMQAAPSVATVLLLGESGTGKELLARAIHDCSPRWAGPFVPVNCAALPERILEAELFGYEKGAFTGAVQRHDGRFLQADGGTLFLDEIGEIPTHVQVKLLRVLQEGEIERLGGRTVKVDLRLVAATNQDLRAAVREGRFREDLYYRLNVIEFPSRRCATGARTCPCWPSISCRSTGPATTGTCRVFRAPRRTRWGATTGRATCASWRTPWSARWCCRAGAIELEDLSPEVRTGSSSAGDGKSLTFAVGTPLEEIERRVIHATLAHTGGDKRVCAQLLGIATRTIYRRLEEQRGEPGTGIPDADASEAQPEVPNWQGSRVAGSR